MRATGVKGAVFLGGGRITTALIAGLRLARYPEPIVVHDRHKHKMAQLRRQYSVDVEQDLHRAVSRARLLIVAVRPDSVKELLAAIGEIQRSILAVSVAAGIPLSLLRKHLPLNWARAMPSPTCRARLGLTALAYSREMST